MGFACARLVGAGIVSHDITRIQPFQVVTVFQQFSKFTFSETQACHAGIDMDYRRQRAAERAPLGRPQGTVCRVDENRHQVVLTDHGPALFRDSFENEDLGIRQECPQRHPFLVCRGEKLAAAGMTEDRCDFSYTQSIRIGLDDRGAGGRPQLFTAIPVVRLERVEVDGD